MDAKELYKKIEELEWDTDKLAVVMGWRCPVCGRGLAPDVRECPCAKNVENAWNFWVDALETMKLMGIIPYPPPEA